MTEYIGLLTHHRDKMKHLYDKHSCRGSLHSLSVFHSFGLAFRKAPDGTNAYPVFESKGGQHKLENTLEKVYRAIQEDRTFEIPEENEKGVRNFDLICDVCGNKEGHDCRLLNLVKSSNLDKNDIF